MTKTAVSEQSLSSAALHRVSARLASKLCHRAAGGCLPALRYILFVLFCFLCMQQRRDKCDAPDSHRSSVCIHRRLSLIADQTLASSLSRFDDDGAQNADSVPSAHSHTHFAWKASYNNGPPPALLQQPLTHIVHAQNNLIAL